MDSKHECLFQNGVPLFMMVIAFVVNYMRLSHDMGTANVDWDVFLGAGTASLLEAAREDRVCS